MNKFIMAVDCPVCGRTVKADGLTVDFTADEGVVNLCLFSQQDFHCEVCGTDIYTGDMEDHLWYEEPEDEYDEDDEEGDC